MLPFFFQHFDPWVERYFIFDNGSTDGSLELLKRHAKVELGSFSVAGDSFVDAARQHYDHCWKVSRDAADWVYICNVDEFLYCPQLPEYLERCQQEGVSVIVPEGYEMVSRSFPRPGAPLCEQVRYGVRSSIHDKPQLFSPRLIEEINFAPGRHTAQPTGAVKMPDAPAVKLLHYKYCGLGYTNLRQGQLGQRLRQRDRNNQWGIHYLNTARENRQHLRRLQAESVQVVPAPPAARWSLANLLSSVAFRRWG